MQDNTNELKPLLLSHTQNMKEDREFGSDTEAPSSTTKKKKKSKKRNRDQETEETQKTETETKQRIIKATVELIPDQPNKTPPLVGYFPSGFDPTRLQDGGSLDGEESSSAAARVRVYRNMNERRNRTGRLELVVSPEGGSGVEYVGTSYSGEAMAPQFCQYAVGVLDKERQTLRVVPIASNKVSLFGGGKSGFF